jgi:predicted NACHT family NTPase
VHIAGREVLTSLADDATRAALQEFARAAVQRLVAPRSKGRRNGGDELERTVRKVVGETDSGRFGRHVAEAATWAGMIHVQGMAGPVDTQATTVPIDMAPVARRFRAHARPNIPLTERDLVTSTSNYLVLGEPGAGKTTALKRLTLSMFDEIPSDPNADLAFPVVLVCRELNWRDWGRDDGSTCTGSRSESEVGWLSG